MGKTLLICFIFKYCFITAQCSTNKTLATGVFSTSLTQSTTWIKTLVNALPSQTTIMSSTAVIKLDADPINGYVELNPGVLAFPTSGFFVAQALDGCGTASPSKISQIKDTKNNDDLLTVIYPNPTNNSLNILINKEQIYSLYLTSMDGRELMRTSIKNVNEYKINVIDLPTGVYFVNIITTEGKTFKYKFIKN